MYSNKIDFNDASIEWNKNKIKNRNGYYQYKCKLCDEPIYFAVVRKKFKLFNINMRQHMTSTTHLCQI